MGWFKNLKIKYKVAAASGLFLLIIITLGSVALYAARTLDTSFTSMYEDRLVCISDLSRIAQNKLQIRINMVQEFRHLQEKETAEMEKRMEYSAKLGEENTRLWKKYMGTYLTPEEKALADEFVRLDANTADIRHRFAEATKAGKVREAEALLDQWGKVYDSTTRVALEKLMKYQDEQSQKMRAEEQVLVRSLLGVVIGSLVFAAVLAVGVTLLLNSTVATPINSAILRVKDIAEGEGDLTKRLDVQSKEEVGELAGWLNMFFEKVHAIVKNIVASSDGIATATESLSRASQTLSAGSEQTSQQSSTIAAAATEMSQNLQVLSSGIEEMSISVAEVARRSAEASRIAMEANSAALSTDQTMQELGHDAEEIGNVIASISDIADQTRMLALNATIEASSAGAAGKTFAVVAAEIKELARQTGQASEEIRKKITGIQKSTQNAVTSIGKITETIAKVNEINANIASAVEEQSIAAKEISSNIGQTTQASNEVAQNVVGISAAAKDGAREAATSSEQTRELLSLSQTLHRMVQGFKV